MKYLLFIIVLLIGGYFRFYKLGEVPKGFYLDEAAIGYNAYSLKVTGKDEFGKTLPVVFRSFGDFKAPVYGYILALVLNFAELGPRVTRLPSAVAGLFSVVILYLLVKEISPKKYKRTLPLLSAFLLAVSPWHIVMSRTTYETNLALLFLMVAILLFYKSFKKQWLLVVSAIFWALSFLTYHSERIVAPVILILLVFHHRKIMWDNLRKSVLPLTISVILGVIMVLPTVLIARTPGFSARASVLNIFSTQRNMPYGHDFQASGQISFLINEKVTLMAREFLSLYSSYYSPRFLFNLGDAEPRSSYPDVSAFFAWQFPFYVLGLIVLFRCKNLGKLRYFVVCMLLVSPIPASLTRDPYSTIRALPQLIPLVMVMSLGLDWLVKNRAKYQIMVAVVLLGVSYSVIKLNSSVFKLNEYFRASYWGYGIEEAIKTVIEDDSDLPIIIDNSRAEPYIQALFWLKYSPDLYQADNIEVLPQDYYENLSRVNEKYLGKVTVKNIEFGKDTSGVEQYLICDALALSDQQIEDHNLVLVKDIFLPNGPLAYRVLKTKL